MINPLSRRPLPVSGSNALRIFHVKGETKKLYRVQSDRVNLDISAGIFVGVLEVSRAVCPVLFKLTSKLVDWWIIQHAKLN
jgi:hypothetical protein